MNNPVSGESNAKGLSVILPYIAVDPAAVAIRRPELLEMLGIWRGVVRLGVAGPGKAWHEQGKEYGRAGFGQSWHGKA